MILNHAGRLAVILGIFSVSQSAAANSRFSEPTFSLIEKDSIPGAFEATSLPRDAGVASDCGLNDITSIGQTLWAVGDRGLILKSLDSGTTWSHRFLPFECCIHRVQFLTDDVGFLCGSRFDRSNNTGLGFIVVTEDAGLTWRFYSGGPNTIPIIGGTIKLPRFPAVLAAKFFGLESAIALCRTPDGPSVVITTKDGGVTWDSVESDNATHFQAAEFVSVKRAILGGKNLSVGSLLGNKTVQLSSTPRTQHEFRAASFDNNGHCWLVGTAGSVLHSRDGGVNFLPVDVAGKSSESFDFACIDQKGSGIAVGGFPGSNIYLSHDSGSTWSAVSTNCTLPLRKIHWVNETTVLAAGELGVIHRSTDRGRSWKNLRGRDHRISILQIVSDPQHTSTRIAAELSAERGFRSVVWQPTVDTTRQVVPSPILAQRFSEVGISSFQSNTWFSRRLTDVDRSSKQLLADWGRQSDGKAMSLLPGQIATAIRTWKPDVVCVQASEQQSELLYLLTQATTAAEAVAADSDYSPLSGLNLPAWKVTHTLRTAPVDQTAHVRIPGDRLLSRLGTNVDLLAAEKGSRTQSTAADSFIFVDGKATTLQGLSVDLSASRVGGNRREISVVNQTDKDEIRSLQRQVQMQQAANAQLMSSEQPLAAIAEMHSQIARLPKALAIRQLKELAILYRSNENIDGEIEVLKQLVQRFPSSPDVASAAERLFLLYSSSEFRSRRAIMDEDRKDVSIKQQEKISRAGGFVLKPARNTIQQAAARKQFEASWDKNADAALEVLKRVSPIRYQSAEVQLRQAANRLRLQDYSGHQQALASAQQNQTPLAFLAKAEMQSVHIAAADTPIPVLHATYTNSRPFLDGRLDDDCWQKAHEIRLSSTSTAANVVSEPLLMIAWDENFLYVAARVKKPNGQSVHSQPTAIRRHDSDHGVLDRLELCLDIDRDYQTAFRFTVDESGQTSESCCDLRQFNPAWYVAHETEGDAWRFEAAIPADVIQPGELTAGTLWAVQLERILPGILHHQIGDSRTAFSRHQYGLLRLIQGGSD